MAFFQAIAPHAQMMSDLLAIFERAGAKRTDNSLAIEFSFDLDIPPLKFDLEHFRESVWAWKTLQGRLITALWNNDTLWILASTLRRDGGHAGEGS